MTIANRVYKLRKKMEISQSELGDLIGGVSYQSIQNLENGKVTRPRYLSKLAEILGTSTDYLIDGNEQSSKINSAKLQDCITVVQRVVTANAINISVDQQAKLVAYLYAEDHGNTKIADSKVIELSSFFA